jgi:DNA-binding MarR family transcriptional regulator
MISHGDLRGRELFEVLTALSREIRCYSRDEAICGNVTFQQFVILDAVAKSGGLDLADLHPLLSVEKSTTTRLVNPLLQKGLLNRDRAKRDSRAATLTLTVEGKEMHRQVWLCLEGFFTNISRNLPQGRRAEVLEAVRTFMEAMKKAAVDCRCCEPSPLKDKV